MKTRSSLIVRMHVRPSFRNICSSKGMFCIAPSSNFPSIFVSEWTSYLFIHASGFLTSPYYPSFYLNNMKRQWQLRAPLGKRVHIKFLYLNLEDDPQCGRDFVSLQDIGRFNKTSFYCGKTLSAKFTSRNNLLHITFQTDNSNFRTGFKLQYDVIDGEKYSGLFL